ncbi:MAG TPA: ribulose-phosphate 3-epimerase [Anaerolineae bacterium]|nr:ribulose-phosphate 3-epimerase [Anaerolineae bacterium]
MKISASLASAPLDKLGWAIGELEKAGINKIHFDVEDGSFVPVMTLGTKIIKDLRPLIDLPFDVHLMMNNPEWIIEEIVDYGADSISVHWEACPYPRRTLHIIKETGVKAGIAFNPATSLPDLAFLKPYLDYVLILSSEPELPDAPFISDTLHKITLGRKNQNSDGIEWVIDGGINLSNIREVTDAYPDMIVIGRAIFKHDAIIDNLLDLRKAIGK